MDDVSGSPEFIGEGETPRRQSLCMMEEQKLSHVGCSLTSRRRVRAVRGSSPQFAPFEPSASLPTEVRLGFAEP